MTGLTAILHAGALPMPLEQAFAVIGAGGAAVVAVAYLFYQDYKRVFQEVKQ